MEKAMYYRYRQQDGKRAMVLSDPEDKDSPLVPTMEIEEVGPLPADGKWPSEYAKRGLSLQRPFEGDSVAAEPAVLSLCPVDDCDAVEPMTDEELIAHVKEAHDENAEVFRGIVSGELVLIEHVDPPKPLSEMVRRELNEEAERRGLDPKAYRTNPDIIAAIEALGPEPSLEEENETLRGKVKELEALLEKATAPAS